MQKKGDSGHPKAATDVAALSKWMTTNEFADFIRIHPNTAQKWRSRGKGPKAHLIPPRMYRYDRLEVEAFVRGRSSAVKNGTDYENATLVEPLE